MAESFARRHPRIAASLMAVGSAYMVLDLVRGYRDPDNGVPMMIWHGSGLFLALLLVYKPWRLWTCRDLPHSLSRSAPRWPRPDPSPFRRTHRGERGASSGGPR